MDTLLDQIRASVAADATQEARAAGVHACRTILAALTATPGKPLAQPPASAAGAVPPAAIKAAVSMLRSMPVEQLLDLAIGRLRAAMPLGAEVAAVQPIKFNIVPLQTQR